MDLHAYTKTVYDIFSINKKYVVPRFQREYSWGEDEVTELWRDLVSSILMKESKLENQEYFIGSLVLVGEDKSTEFKIVDGQQRLTTITMLLSALVDSFREIKRDDLARGLYAFIEGRDVSDKQFFKLENENPKPFLQNSIQNFQKVPARPGSEEESNLLNAFVFFAKRLQKNSLAKEFGPFWETCKADEPTKYCSILEALRDQALTFLKTIYITVGNEDEAYTIFETLNARGMNLSPVDLMKNEIFKVLADEHPVDAAKFKWKSLHSTLAAREERIDIDIYVRHFWLSKYEFTTEDKIYKSFKRKTNSDKALIKAFLDDIVQEADYYKKITMPLSTDWKQQEEKSIFDSLSALNIFKVTQVRTFLLALLAQRDKKLLDLTDLKECATALENFHFLFSAITSSRASGLESKYSKYARSLRSCKDAKASRDVLKDLREDIKQKVPALETVREGFKALVFTNEETRYKKLIQYLFRRWEIFLRKTNELEPAQITIEHVVPQSDAKLAHCVGSIGNLLPLGGTINNLADAKDFTAKIALFKQSKLSIVAEFVKRFQAKKEWSEGDINDRTVEIADLAFTKIWKL
jgi:uncharacterized protein with ParB-like and HNH nuclease domain